MNGIDDLSFVQLFAGEACDALALLHEPQERRVGKKSRHLDEIVHEVAVQARCRRDQHVILRTAFQLFEPQNSSLPFPSVLRHELQEM